jgi:hypothetical protein
MNNLEIKEIKYKSKDYYKGLNYLLKNYQDNTHIISCYEGISFRNLARYINFDRKGKVLKLDKYLKVPRRILLIDESFEIYGVAIMVSLPEFRKEIGCEDYIIIVAGNKESYKKLLDYLSTEGKSEIVVFAKNQNNIVKRKYLIKKIHYWSVFSSVKKSSIKYHDYKLMDDKDFPIARKLSKTVPEESSPFRLLNFQIKDFPYYNYKFSFGESFVFIGICPYATKINQIAYLINNSTDKNAVLALEALNSIYLKRGNRLIWRLRKKEISKFKNLFRHSTFKDIIKEYHLHIKSPISMRRKRA